VTPRRRKLGSEKRRDNNVGKEKKKKKYGGAREGRRQDTALSSVEIQGGSLGGRRHLLIEGVGKVYTRQRGEIHGAARPDKKVFERGLTRTISRDVRDLDQPSRLHLPAQGQNPMQGKKTTAKGESFGIRKWPDQPKEEKDIRKHR